MGKIIEASERFASAAPPKRIDRVAAILAKAANITDPQAAESLLKIRQRLLATENAANIMPDSTQDTVDSSA